MSFLLIYPPVTALVLGSGWQRAFAEALNVVPYVAIAGYVIDILIAGTLLVADHVRRLLARRAPMVVDPDHE
jgi:hypothetical protein